MEGMITAWKLQFLIIFVLHTQEEIPETYIASYAATEYTDVHKTVYL